MTPPEEIQRSSSSTSAGAANVTDPGGVGTDKDKQKKTIERYKEKYRLLSIRSAILQQENEELTNKLTTIRETIRKARKIRRQLLQKLDADNDAWRLGTMTVKKEVATPSCPNSLASSAVVVSTSSRILSSTTTTTTLVAPTIPFPPLLLSQKSSSL